MARIASALRRIKDDSHTLLNHQLVVDACRRAGHVWRDRQLDPVTTLRLFILQVLHGNVACRRLRHLCGLDVSAQAYCNARQRLPVDVFGDLAASLIGMARRTCDSVSHARGWCGHRVWLIDGSSVSMPDRPALRFARERGRRGKGRGSQFDGGMWAWVGCNDAQTTSNGDRRACLPCP